MRPRGSRVGRRRGRPPIRGCSPPQCRSGTGRGERSAIELGCGRDAAAGALWMKCAPSGGEPAGCGGQSTNPGDNLGIVHKTVDPEGVGVHSAFSTRNASVPDGQHRRRFGVEGGFVRLRPIGHRKVTLATREDFGPTDPSGRQLRWAPPRASARGGTGAQGPSVRGGHRHSPPASIPGPVRMDRPLRANGSHKGRTAFGPEATTTASPAAPSGTTGDE